MDLGKGTPRCERCRNLSVGLHEPSNEYLCQACWEPADDEQPADTSLVDDYEGCLLTLTQR